jgi:Zn-dependent protease
MRDPFSWSIPLGRWFGITVRIHILFPFLVAGVLLRVVSQKDPPYVEGRFLDAALLMGILFVSVLVHEFGHCAGARLVDGDAHEILLWPLGGLAAIEVPQQARAHFVAVAAGPLTNLGLCLVAGLLLMWRTGFEVYPPLHPFWYPYRPSANVLAELPTWGGAAKEYTALTAEVLLARIFWVNWVLFLLNLLPAFPLDGGRLAQCLLWPWYGFRQATLFAIFIGFVTMLLIGIAAIAWNEVLPLLLAAFIYLTCRHQWIILETGGEESLFGYDFSQGYTSLEGEAPPRRRRPNFWQRWKQKRALQKRLREQERRQAEELRMDELLDKVHREGLNALTEEERRFLKRVSDQKRHH